MKKLIMLFLLISTAGFSQILEPVKWKTSVEKISKLEYNLVFTATIDDHWHLYSQNVPENGPLPTVFSFSRANKYKLVGKASEGKGKTVYEDVFEMEIKYFENKAVFKQRIQIENENLFSISGDIEFMSCDNSRCVLGNEDFEFKIL